MSDIDISIVVPVHNEEPQIAIFFAEICRVLGSERFEVLFVDDGSADGTWNAVREAGSRDARAGGIRLSRTSIEFEVPATGRPTRWSFLRLTKFSVDAITSFTPWPLFLVALAGVVFAAFSVILGIDTLYMYFSGRAVTGFTTVILLTLIVGAAVMFGIAILGLYVSRLFDEVKARPRAVSIETITPAPRAASVTAAAESPATV